VDGDNFIYSSFFFNIFIKSSNSLGGFIFCHESIKSFTLFNVSVINCFYAGGGSFIRIKYPDIFTVNILNCIFNSTVTSQKSHGFIAISQNVTYPTSLPPLPKAPQSNSAFHLFLMNSKFCNLTCLNGSCVYLSSYSVNDFTSTVVNNTFFYCSAYSSSTSFLSSSVSSSDILSPDFSSISFSSCSYILFFSVNNVSSTSSQCTFSALKFFCCFNEIESSSSSSSYVSYDFFENSVSSKDKTNDLSNDNILNDDIDYYDVKNIYDIDNNNYEINKILNDHSENDKMEINKKNYVFDEMSLIFISFIRPTPISISVRQSTFENCFVKLKNYSEYDSCLFPIHSHSIYIQGRNCTFLSSPTFSSFYCYSSSNSITESFSASLSLSDLVFKKCCNINGSVMLLNNINGFFLLF
jgi:hypothetical protein